MRIYIANITCKDIERTEEFVAAGYNVGVKIPVAAHGVMLPGTGALVLVGKGEICWEGSPHDQVCVWIHVCD